LVAFVAPEVCDARDDERARAVDLVGVAMGSKVPLSTDSGRRCSGVCQ
jgi:hypothetical protein